MLTQILRPNGEWLIRWGDGEAEKRRYGPISRLKFYGRVHRELIDSGILPSGSLVPTNRHHRHVTLVVGLCSWHGGRWVLDGPLPEQIQEIVRAATMPCDTVMA